MNEFKKLVSKLSLIEGVSKRQSEKIAFSLLFNKDNISELRDVVNISTDLNICKNCGLPVSHNNCKNCSLDIRLMVIINNVLDYLSVENKIKENVKYFALNFKNKSSYTNVDAINSAINNLIKFLNNNEVEEILFLLSPSFETELVIKILKEEIYKNNFNSIKLSRLNIGIPFGGSIEYSDEKTLREAINKREEA